MKRLLLSILIVSLLLSCSKNAPAPNPASPLTPGTPQSPSTSGPPISLSHPTPQDTLNDWVRIGRVAANLLDICFTENKVGFITDGTNLYRTLDLGNNWTLIPNTTVLNIFNLQFVDNQQGFVQGNNKLGITRDGGNTWIFKLLPSTSAFCFQFLNGTSGFYADLSAGIKKTQDAGNSWTSLTSPQQQNFPFYFLDSLTGFSMFGGNFNKTTNGGLNWTVISSNVMTSGNGYFKMQFIDSSSGFCATPLGLSKTNDGGKTWINCLNISTNFMIPYFLDSNNGYCLDTHTIYKTDNGGLNWTISCQLPEDSFSGLHMLDMSTGWASTYGGFVLRLK